MHKEQKLLWTVIIILSNVLFSGAQENVGEGGSGVVQPTTTVSAGKPSQAQINSAEEYLQQKLGESYVGRWIILESAAAYKDCVQAKCTQRNEILFLYKIPFSTEGIDPHFSLQPNQIQLTLDETGKITRYSGPKKPYRFLVNAEQAKEKAEEYGLQQITDVVLSTSALTSDGYGLVWAVGSSDEVARGAVMNEPLYRGVYIDIDTGEIRGEYRINPLIEVPGGSGGGVELGNFFKDEQNQQKTNTQQQKSLSFVLIGTVIVVIGVIMLIWRSKNRQYK